MRSANPLHMLLKEPQSHRRIFLGEQTHGIEQIRGVQIDSWLARAQCLHTVIRLLALREDEGRTRVMNKHTAGADQRMRVAHVFAVMQPRLAFAGDDPFAPADMARNRDIHRGARQHCIRGAMPIGLRQRAGIMADFST